MTSRSPHRRHSLVTAAAVVVLAAGVAACSSSSSSPGKASGSSGGSGNGSGKSATAATLVMESSPETSITQDFNPYAITQPVYGMGADGLIYEPLYQFDLAKPSISYPWLATGYQWANGGKSITFTIRQGVKWNNGTPFTAADVAFTFNMLKTHAAMNQNGLKITSVSTSGNTVTLTFPSPQYTSLLAIAGTAIVPKSIWSKVSDPATFSDPNPVGTGPFMLDTFTSQGITLKKNPGYWQAAKVKVPKVYFPVYTSNTGALNALYSNQIDWTGNFIPGLKQKFVSTNPSLHHYWEAANSSNALWPNLHTWPTNQLAVRKAISLAINRSLIASEGEAGLENPVLNSTGLTLPTYQAWSGPVASMTNQATAQAAAAAKVLTQAGFTKGSDGFFSKGGKKVSITITDPSAYTDYAEDDQLVAQQLKAAGIDATFQGQSVQAWNTAVSNGTFQLTMHWGSGGLTPYKMYDYWLDSSLASGKSATGDFERLSNPAMDSALAKLAGDHSVSAQTTDLVPLEQYVAQNLPIIPTTTASEWFEYNSQHYTGWPTAANPYESGQPSGSNNGGTTGTDEVVILHLVPRG